MSIYGRDHQRARARLRHNLVDGTLCEYCGRPMFRNAEDNFDGRTVEADHINADTSRPPGRLIHHKCNRTIVTKWTRHGPGWYLAHGLEVPHQDDSVPGAGKVLPW
ncbi:hypothetical protein [Pasteurella phage PMP-GADVASU-IND]|nr:hypothetical protein [Pasteurella phage PMP-GADVASU-IND]